MQSSPQLPLWPLPLMLILAAFVSASLAFPEARQILKEHWVSQKRHILAKVEGDLTGQGDRVSVIKVKTHENLSLEVYSINRKDGKTRLRTRMILPEKNDGYFEFRGQPTNLALVDINGDGLLEIVAPTFDDNLIPRLRIYYYDPDAQVFQLASPDFVPLDSLSH